MVTLASVLTLIAPVPTPTPTSSPSPSQLPTLVPTPVTTPSPITVVVDQGPGWFDYLGLGINSLATLAGLFGLFLAIRAYQVSHESYRIAKEQGKKTFEIEILRELNSELSRVLDTDTWDMKNPELPHMGSAGASGLVALPKSELPVWRLVARPRKPGDDLNDIREAPGVREYLASGEAGSLQAAIVWTMLDEVLEAIRKRVG